MLQGAFYWSLLNQFGENIKLYKSELSGFAVAIDAPDIRQFHG